MILPVFLTTKLMNQRKLTARTSKNRLHSGPKNLRKKPEIKK